MFAACLQFAKKTDISVAIISNLSPYGHVVEYSLRVYIYMQSVLSHFSCIGFRSRELSRPKYRSIKLSVLLMANKFGYISQTVYKSLASDAHGA